MANFQIEVLPMSQFQAKSCYKKNSNLFLLKQPQTPSNIIADIVCFRNALVSADACYKLTS